jgi:hypothetical protein
VISDFGRLAWPKEAKLVRYLVFPLFYAEMENSIPEHVDRDIFRNPAEGKTWRHIHGLLNGALEDLRVF